MVKQCGWKGMLSVESFFDNCSTRNRIPLTVRQGGSRRGGAWMKRNTYCVESLHLSMCRDPADHSLDAGGIPLTGHVAVPMLGQQVSGILAAFPPNFKN